MTVVLVGRIQKFVGVSSDTKPTNPPVGSTFQETNTGIKFIYDGTTWQRLGEVITKRVTKSSNTTRLALHAPATGKKIRVISAQMSFDHATALTGEIYFGTGANITTNTDKAVMQSLLDVADHPYVFASWAKGDGPVGGVNEDLSIRASASVAGILAFIIHFREE